MQETDKLSINLSLNEIKRSIVHLHDKIETISNNKQTIDIKLFKDDILKELYIIKKEIDKKPKGTSTELDSLRFSINNIQKTLIEEVCPAVQTQPSGIDLSFLFNDVNKNLLNIHKKVCELEIKSSLDSTIITDINTQLTNISNTVNKSYIEIIETSETSILISYPTSGTATITEGDTLFDFREGKVTYADGTVYNMSGSSEIDNEIYIKSFAIFTDRPVDISMYGKNSYTTSIPSGSFRLKSVEVSRIKVHTSDDTNIWICGSTVSDGAPNISFSFGNSDSIGMPNSIIDGTKTDISTTAAQIVTASTPINKVVTVIVLSLGNGTYIAIGNSTSQSTRLTAIGDSYDIDFVDNLNKIYCVADIGSTSSISYTGG